MGIILAVLSNKAEPAVEVLCDNFFPGIHLYSLLFGERGGHYLIFGFVEMIFILFPMVILSNLLAFLISNLILGNGWSIVI